MTIKALAIINSGSRSRRVAALALIAVSPLALSAIDVSGMRGIDGSNGRGIDGSNGREVLASVGSVAYESAALGPVESIQASQDGSTVITVLGQSFTSPDGVAVALGDYVVAASANGDELDVLIPVGEAYVAGASEVWAVGMISNVSASTGMMTIGTATVDYTTLLSEAPSYAPESGTLTEIAGVQPVFGGPVLMGINGSNRR